MDFQTHQTIARKGTSLLVILFFLGTMATVLILSTLASIWPYIKFGPEIGTKVFLVTAACTGLGIFLSAVVKNARVRNGGGMYLAASVGGWPVDVHTTEPAEKQLINIVEEIAVATGVRAPMVFVLRDEAGINAMAAGWDVDNAAIGVTRGALRHLTRTELQAVIAHEFSHIVNGDTQVKTRVLGWVYGITSIAVLGKSILKNAFRSRRPGRQGSESPLVSILVGTLLIAVGSIGAWFARQAQAAIGREREHLADASAVEYTRDPEALAGALLKIGALGEQNELFTPHATEAAHLFFDSPLKTSHRTHPPLPHRVLTLLPSWDRRWPALKSVKESVNIEHDISFDGFALPVLPGLPSNVAEPAQNIPGVSQSPLGPILGAAVLLGADEVDPSADTSATSLGFETPTIGSPTPAHLERAQSLLAKIPQQTRDLLHTNEGAVAAIIGLLVSEDPALRPRELMRASAVSGFDAHALHDASTLISTLDRQLQLPCVDMALDSIITMPNDFQVDLLNATRKFTTASPDTDLFRWMLRRVVIAHLSVAEGVSEAKENLHLEWLGPQAGAIYAVISLFNSAGDKTTAETFYAAHRAAGLPTPSELPTTSSLRVEKLDSALDKLAEMTEEGRTAFITGAIAAVTFDGHTSIDEAELIRVIADAVRLPMPPLLPLAPTANSGGMAA